MAFLQGRTNRATYWLCLAIIVLLLFLANIVARKPIALSEVVLVILCVPRLHDIGRSGWFMVGPLVFEVVGAVLGFTLLPAGVAMSAMVGVTLVIIGLVIWLGTIPGQPAANRFGEPPAPGIPFKRRAKTI
jgi:uncharacterized membrane protein YhaH (DUF805 family)